MCRARPDNLAEYRRDDLQSISPDISAGDDRRVSRIPRPVNEGVVRPYAEVFPPHYARDNLPAAVLLDVRQLAQVIRRDLRRSDFSSEIMAMEQLLRHFSQSSTPVRQVFPQYLRYRLHCHTRPIGELFNCCLRIREDPFSWPPIPVSRRARNDDGAVPGHDDSPIHRL